MTSMFSLMERYDEPFSLAIFALPIVAAQKLGPTLDTTLTLPGNATFQRESLGMAAVALAFSFVRQGVGLFLKRRLERPHAAPLQVQTD